MQSRNNGNLKGIDISMWKENINFNKVKNAGYSVVIIKATEGVDYVDPQMNNHYNGAKGEGLKIGFYHFMSDKTDPVQQAHDFWNQIKDKKFDIIPVLDIEKETKGRNKTQVTDRCISFLNAFRELSGLDCIIYTYTSFANEYIDSRLSKYPLWIAEYGSNDGSKQQPTNNNVWSSWVGFQYTDKGSLPGVNGDTDLNEFTEKIFISGRKPISPNKPKYEREYEEHGTCTVVVDSLNIRSNPSLSASIEGSYNRGDSVIYDYVIDNDGYRWIRWVGATSGKYRYMAVRDLKTGKRLGHCV